MRVPYNVNEIPFKTLIYVKEELNEILNNRTEFNEYETTNIIRYMLELIKYSSLATEEELNKKNVQLYTDYLGITNCRKNNYKCLKDMLEYINEKIKIHNFYEMMKD